MKPEHFDTRAIHAGEEHDQHQALNYPLYLSSTFTFTDIQQAEDTFSFKRKAYVYTRGGNPTLNLLERRIASLESGEGAVAFASGMAAITSTLLSLVQQGETILAHNTLYGSSFSAIKTLFARFGITANFVDMTNPENIKNAIDKNTKVIYFETPTNPALEIIDIAAVAKIAKAQNIKVVIDNTFATPYFQKPLELGADIVVHSATKYISGHGDVVAGLAIAKDEQYLAELKFGFMCELGGVLSPFNAWLLLRGLKTLSLRMNRHEENAKAIVSFLDGHPKITRLMYPGLTMHPGYNTAKDQMLGFGGILSFELEGDQNTAQQFVENLKLAKLAVSLGDAETLVEIPAMMTHRSYSEADLKTFGFSKKTIRISTGLEHYNDIIADIEQALAKI